MTGIHSLPCGRSCDRGPVHDEPRQGGSKASRVPPRMALEAFPVALRSTSSFCTSRIAPIASRPSATRARTGRTCTPIGLRYSCPNGTANVPMVQGFSVPLAQSSVAVPRSSANVAIALSCSGSERFRLTDVVSTFWTIGPSTRSRMRFAAATDRGDSVS